jgi:hypothetical protein
MIAAIGLVIEAVALLVPPDGLRDHGRARDYGEWQGDYPVDGP